MPGTQEAKQHMNEFNRREFIALIAGAAVVAATCAHSESIGQRCTKCRAFIDANNTRLQQYYPNTPAAIEDRRRPLCAHCAIED